MEQYTITRLDKLDKSYREQVMSIFAESFVDLLNPMCKGRSMQIEIFEPCLEADMFYICLDGDQVAGFLALSDDQRRTFDIEKSRLLEIFGPIKGKFKKFRMSLLIGKPEVERPEDGYIDFVATNPAYRGKGIATKLIDYVGNHAGVTSLTLDVVSNNIDAIRLYNQLGFKTIKTLRNPLLWLEGIWTLYYMKKTFNDEPR